MELSSGESKGGLEVGDLAYGVLGEVSNNESVFHVDEGSCEDVVESSSDGVGALNTDGSFKTSGDGGKSWDNCGVGIFVAELSSDGNGLSGSVDSQDLWDSVSHVISGKGKVKELIEEVGDVKSVSSVVSRLESGVDSVLGGINLEGFFGWVTEWEWDSLFGVGLWCISVEEGSVDGHLNVRVI